MRYRLLSSIGYVLHLLFRPLLRGLQALLAYGRLEDLRRRGHRVGLGVRLGKHSDIHVVGTGRISIGDGTCVAEYSSIVVGDGAFVEIGKDCYLSRNLFLGCSRSVAIGDRVAIGGYVTILDVNKRFEDPSRPIIDQGSEASPVRIEDDAWIGGGTTVLPGTTIGRHCVVGACSLVRGHLPPNSLAVGVPAKIIRSLEA